MENVLNDTVRAAVSTQASFIAEFDEVVRRSASGLPGSGLAGARSR